MNESPPASAPPQSLSAVMKGAVRYGAILVLGLAAVCSIVVLWRPSIDQLICQGEIALADRELAKADALARRVMARDTNSPPGLLLVGRIAAAQGRFHEAYKFFERIPDAVENVSLTARTECGDLALFKLRNLELAEDLFQRALGIDPGHVMAHNRLAFLLGIESRWWESAAHRLAIIRAGKHTAADLYIFSLGDRALESPETLRAYAVAHPDDNGVLLGLARVAIERKDYAAALQSLQRMTTEPRFALEAQVLRGRCLFEQNSAAAFAEWESKLTDEIAAHPAVWRLRGEWAQQHNQPNDALWFYREAYQRDPDHAATCYRLGQLLVAQGRARDAAPFLDRAQRLELYARSTELAYRVQESADFQRAVEAAEAAGLLWEARGWAQLAGSQHPFATWVGDSLRRVEPQMAALGTARAAASTRIPLKFTESEVRPRSPSRMDSHSPSTSEPAASVSFADQAAQAGLAFRYNNGGDPSRGLVRMSEITGGGIAVLDYDGDGWPDLYFPQGGPWPREQAPRPTDQLFRNTGNGRYEDVTTTSGLFEESFGQGATVGDVDGDGFPDVYVANIGGNRFWHNNGDGTWADVTTVAGIAGDDYSASAVLADFNGDAFSDLYVVNYLTGDDVFERICGGDDGIARSCLPQSFPAAADRFYVNRGDGRFEEMTEAAGMNVTPGKGLGVIAADFAGTGRLCLYVINDVGPNFLFVNQTPQRGDPPLFVEQGLSAGVALDRDGRFNSGMGAAVGDVDDDGRLDLFVTNFEMETNTLYRQYAGLHFSDETHAAGLGAVSLPYVGWGTQFVDAELDGRLDLLITNGHVNNLEDHGKPYRMPPQFLSNVGQGRFVERSAESLGSFFTEPSLGRGMARLDWNRDGRDDVVISHLDRPAALLTNTTESTGHALGLRLRGVQSERDAIGTTVIITVDGRRLMRQLTAGDGNQSSNERLLVIGLGSARIVDQMEIRWPSGITQQFEQIPADREVVIIEGRPQFHVLRRWDDQHRD
ncbi:MAG: FG-GAP-like repeat-containing protein [Planctomycetaceae bacterium]|nr:FG-GAP-like repeat-containing protein [Planctomycetaceae bacterium]